MKRIMLCIIASSPCISLMAMEDSSHQQIIALSSSAITNKNNIMIDDANATSTTTAAIIPSTPATIPVKKEKYLLCSKTVMCLCCLPVTATIDGVCCPFTFVHGTYNACRGKQENYMFELTKALRDWFFQW